MLARLSAFVIWSLVAATAVFWLLRFVASPAQVPPYAVAVGKSVVIRGDLTRLFGTPVRSAAANAAVPEAASRFKLVGVMAPRSVEAQKEAGRGLALIAIDGKPAKAFSIGARLDSNLVLQSVGLRTASLGPAQGARSVLLELPALALPSVGTLPAAGVAGTPVPTVGAARPAPGAMSPGGGPVTMPSPPQQPVLQAPPVPNPALPTSSNSYTQ